jgi:hypothetical protein
MARPTKFTPERRERFLVALGAGLFPETAAHHAGWSPATLYRILAATSPDHVAFKAEVRRVETELELRLVGTVTVAAFNDPRLALALLERRFAERWGRRARLLGPADDEQPSGPGRADEVVVLDPALVESIVPRLLAARAGPARDRTDLERFEDRAASVAES